MPSIRIRSHKFDLPRQWLPGHTLTEGEAQAMTQLFCENVRNNVDQWVIECLDQHAGAVLPAEEHSELQRRIGRYALAYEFRSTTAVVGLTPLERHARELAEDALRQEAGLGADQRVDEVELAARSLDPGIRLAAVKRLEVERIEAAEMLAALL